MKVIFFQTGNASPAEDFLFSLEKPSISKCLKIINLLEKYGLSIGLPYVKKVTRNLFELRIRGKAEIRFLFAIKDDIAYILHGFKKKRQKLLPAHIETAQKRLTEI